MLPFPSRTLLVHNARGSLGGLRERPAAPRRVPYRSDQRTLHQVTKQSTPLRKDHSWWLTPRDPAVTDDSAVTRRTALWQQRHPRLEGCGSPCHCTRRCTHTAGLSVSLYLCARTHTHTQTHSEDFPAPTFQHCPRSVISVAVILLIKLFCCPQSGDGTYGGSFYWLYNNRSASNSALGSLSLFPTCRFEGWLCWDSLPSLADNRNTPTSGLLSLLLLGHRWLYDVHVSTHL